MVSRGQSSTELVLLMGGAVLIAFMVVYLLFTNTESFSSPLEDNILSYDNLVGGALSSVPPLIPEPLTGSVSFQNEEVGFVFLEESGKVYLDQILKEPNNPGAFPPFQMKGPYLWYLVARKTADATSVIDLRSDTANCLPIEYAQSASSSKQIIEIYWKDCQLGTNPLNKLTVILHVELKNGSKLGEWKLRVENNTAEYGINRADLSIFISPVYADDQFVLPTASGALIRNPSQSITSPFNAPKNAFWTTFTQFHAYYTHDNVGLFFSTRDPNHYRSKYKGYAADGTQMMFASGEYGENPSTLDDFEFPYPHVIGVFEGDWYDAVQLHRSWVQTTPIVSAGKLSARTDIPLWFKEMGMHLLQNYDAAQLNVAAPPLPGPVAFFTKVHEYYLPCAEYSPIPASCTASSVSPEKMMLFNWNWNMNEYDDTTDTWSYNPAATENEAYGEYVPYPTAPAFAAALAMNNIQLSGYTLSFGTSVNGPSYGPPINLSTEACINPIGNPVLTTEGAPPGSDNISMMDPSSTKWQTHYANIAKNNMAANGMKGIYLDNPYWVSQGCYNPSATHNKGQGGEYIFKGYQDLMNQIRSTARQADPEFVLFFEQGIETYLSSADGFSNYGQSDPPLDFANSSAQTPIPLMETLYHDYIPFLVGNEYPNVALQNYNAYITTPPKFQEAINAMLASGYVRGKIPLSSEPYMLVPGALHDGTANEFDLYTEYLKLLVKVRKSEAKKYMVYGQLLRPLPTSQLGVGADYSYTITSNPPGDTFTHSQPPILHSMWRAEDGKVGLLLLNYTNDAQNATLNIDFSTYGLPSNPDVKELNLLNPNAHVSQVVFQSIPNLPLILSMPPRSVTFYEFS